MGWGCHPDTLCVASAHHRAKEVAGDSGTLEYLIAYRDEYQKEISRNPMRGGTEYISSLDSVITKWKSGISPDFSEILIPGTIGRR